MRGKHVLTVQVQNNTGVLARVSSLFGRRGYNIESLTVSATNDPLVSRMTVVLMGDEDTLQQIINQTAKLEEILDVEALSQGKSLYRELLLVKVEANETTRSAVREICDIYGAQIIDLSVYTMVAELTGTPEKVDAFMEVIQQYPIVEVVRTGAAALERGVPKGYALKNSYNKG